MPFRMDATSYGSTRQAPSPATSGIAVTWLVTTPARGLRLDDREAEALVCRREKNHVRLRIDGGHFGIRHACPAHPTYAGSSKLVLACAVTSANYNEPALDAGEGTRHSMQVLVGIGPDLQNEGLLWPWVPGSRHEPVRNRAADHANIIRAAS